MYSKVIGYKDLNGRPRNEQVHFYLFEREVFKLLQEFQEIFRWQESLREGDVRDLNTREVVDFYNNLEKILLDAYGVPSEDGRSMDRSGRYTFESTALFNACMVEFVSDPQAAAKFLEDVMPKGMDEIVKKADASMAQLESKTEDPESSTEIARLRAELARAQANPNMPAPTE